MSEHTEHAEVWPNIESVLATEIRRARAMWVEQDGDYDAHLAAHVAAVLREQIAAAIEAARPEMGAHINVSDYRRGLDDGLTRALYAAGVWSGDNVPSRVPSPSDDGGPVCPGNERRTT